jgi:hypothetical protein
MKGLRILNLMGNSKKRVLVHKDMESITTVDSIDIILTPQFYTFLKEELGVKFSYQAKQIAPSLFDDYLDNTKEYQYHVYSCEGLWCFFAYSVDEITQFLETKGIKTHQINKIFFTQELYSYMENAIDLGDNLSIQSIEGVVTLLPKRLMDSKHNYSPLDLANISLKNGIALGSSYNAVVPLKQTVIITMLLTILGGVFMFEGNRIRGSIDDSLEKETMLLDKNSKLSSSRVRKSILGEYEPIDRVERVKRDSIKKISKLLSTQNILTKLIINNDKISATIKVKNHNAIKQIESQAKEFKIKKEGNKLIKLEKIL